jgi:quinoprotein glucose dehydrogenase
MVTVFRDDDPPPIKPPTAGEQVYQQFCAACHGPDRIGVGTAPPLRGLRHRLKDEDVRALWKTGRNLMPPQPQLTEEQQRLLLDFLFVRDRPQPPLDLNAPPRYSFGGYIRIMDPEQYPGCKPPWGTLNCLDLNTGKLLWKVPLGDYDVLNKAGVPKTGTENFGGAMTTAGGLVFCSGTRDNKIRAFDSNSGAELWSAPLPLHGTAPPATYEADGRQFIVLPATGGGKLGGPAGDAWVAFALPKKP